MNRPRQLYQVEWSVCRHPDRPSDRVHQERRYATAEAAGDQVAEIVHWSPEYMELEGVWTSTGGAGALDWEPVDPNTLPVSARKSVRLRLMREHSTPYIDMMRGAIP